MKSRSFVLPWYDDIQQIMNGKRTTIYDIAKELGISPSSVSKALNNLPISNKIRVSVKEKAKQLNYRQNSNAANLRRGATKTLGIVLPKLNESFFSNITTEIQNVCFDNDHSLIICQSNESYEKEVLAVETLIRQNVDCVLISISLATKKTRHLQDVLDHHIELIQFDRVDNSIESHKVVNDNKETSYQATRHLIQQGYRKVAFFGGPEHLDMFRDRKLGYISAIKEAGLIIPYNFIVETSLSKEHAILTATELLTFTEKPDAFLCVSDSLSLAVLTAASSMGIEIPQQLGLIGFANDAFTELISPTLSTIDQNSFEMGRKTAELYFNYIMKQKDEVTYQKEVVPGKIVVRQSTTKR